MGKMLGKDMVLIIKRMIVIVETRKRKDMAVIMRDGGWCCSDDCEGEEDVKRCEGVMSKTMA